MSTPPYHFSKPLSTRYEFISLGRRGSVRKVVEISPLAGKNKYSFGFGDLMSNGKIDDCSETNNGDIATVFATLLGVMMNFTTDHPKAELFFVGSTEQRTRVYGKLLSRYSGFVCQHFSITGLLEKDGVRIQVDFDRTLCEEYLAFSIRRKP